tara:strand:+ start:305 stop:691 length:387 start_codon:yes stop_codon:yes gene_type:complete
VASLDHSSKVGLAIGNDGNIYLADVLNHRIQMFGSEDQFLLTWGTYGSGDGQFNHPSGNAIDSKGNVYVVESPNNRIQMVDTQGNFLHKWRTTGGGDGQFSASSCQLENARMAATIWWYGTIVFLLSS